jgi:hypothetical protein
MAVCARVLAASLIAFAIACGSTGLVSLDSLDASADGESEASAPLDAAAEGSAFDAPGFDAAVVDARRYADAPTFPTDAACTGDALYPGVGEPFPCFPGGPTCFAGSSYCGVFSAGRIVPEMGCQPLPCGCAPSAGCACLEPLPDFCTCDVDAGGVTVWCSLP